MSATGIQTSGFNRLSTLKVNRIKKDDGVKYKVKTAGYGLRSPWLSEYKDGTLARALRGLQDFYEAMARTYGAHASYLQDGRKIK